MLQLVRKFIARTSAWRAGAPAGAIFLVATALVIPHPPNGAALWPGAPFTGLARDRAIRRGMEFIYRSARVRKNFSDYGQDYLWCFYAISSTARDPALRQVAYSMGNERAHQWRREHAAVAANAGPDDIADLAFGSDAADRLGIRDDSLKAQIRKAAARYSARSFLYYDPAMEPPPDDVPNACERCQASNPRGARVCHKCNSPLRMRTAFSVWCDALITTYTGDHYGITLGGRYADVIHSLPAMRPYPGRRQTSSQRFYDALYAITHLVYTLNDYSAYRLPPRLLVPEFEFLKTNLTEAIALRDPESMGEFLDTLRSFGMTEADPLIRTGVEYLLSRQNSDGSWGDTDDPDIYNRYHPTWTAIDGLRDYAWHGEGLSFPELRPLLEKWAKLSGSLDRY